ncbi:hypothetical protein MOE08_20260 [Bacillus spizizenii]|nr:hypothetical protein [Bacillus spizizenii]
MITAFKILLMIVIFISLIGVIGETNSQELRNQMTAICITSIIALVIVFVIL